MTTYTTLGLKEMFSISTKREFKTLKHVSQNRIRLLKHLGHTSCILQTTMTNKDTF